MGTSNAQRAIKTTTTDPDILALVEHYKAARAEADAAVRVYMDNGTGDHAAAADMQAKQAELSTIETRLCVMFVDGLDKGQS